MESVLEPCRVRSLVVPVGKWPRQEYLKALNKLKPHAEIRLVDVTPLPESTFNPQLFPHGRVLYSFLSKLVENSSMMFLHDFEPYRKVFVVIGLCNDRSLTEDSCITELKERFGSAISYAVVYVNGCDEPLGKYGFSTQIEPFETIMCDITRNFLEALSTYYSSYKHVTLRSPGAIGGPSVLKTTLTKRQNTGNANAHVKRIISQSSKDNSITSSIAQESSKDKSSKRYSSLNTLSLTQGTSDKSLQRSKARQLKLLANLQLMSGQYLTSMANFTEAARVMHKIHDYIWLGNSLEGISTCMLLLSYLQVPFQVPGIVQSLCSTPQHPGSMLSPTTSRRNSMQSVSSPRNSLNMTSSPSLDSTSIDLPRLIKAIGDKALHYYDYSLANSVEFTPQIVYCKTILRTLNFMSLCYKGGGFNNQVLRSLVFEDDISGLKHDKTQSEDDLFSKTEIYLYSNKIFEIQLKSMDRLSQIQVYLTLAQVYENLEMFRKKVFVIRILFISILSQLENEPILENYEQLIDDLLKAYNIENWEPELKRQDAASHNWITLQKKVLMLIIRIYSVMKDTVKVVFYSQILLKRFSHTLTKREQIDILNDNVLPYKDVHSIDYVDPFLIRDITFTRTESQEMPLLKVLNAKETSGSLDTHQIFNPFAAISNESKGNDTTVSNYFLVSESAKMFVTFQNPFKFDLSISKVHFDDIHNEYMKVGNLTSPIIIPPSTQQQICFDVLFSKSASSLPPLEGLIVSVLGFPSRFFPICKTSAVLENQRYLPFNIPITIIDQQPSLELSSTSLTNNRIMMLDGTTSQFQIYLKNSSLSTPINYYTIEWTTNIETELKDNYWSKLSPDDLYDMENQVAWLKNDFLTISKQPSKIEVNESISLEVNMNVTKAPFDLKWIRISIQYGFLRSSDEGSVYVKTLSIPIQLTLKRTLEIPNIGFIPITESFEESSDISWVKYLQECKDVTADHCLMLLDIRNSWMNSIKFHLDYDLYHSDVYELAPIETRRFVVPIPKIMLSQSVLQFKEIAIPRIDESRQYINSGLTLPQEYDMREKFWCREHVLDHLNCKWSTNGGDISGVVDFRQFLDKFDKTIVKTIYPLSNVFDIKVSPLNAVHKVGKSITVEVTVRSNIQTDSIPLRYHILDYHTGKSVLNEKSKSVLYQGQTLFTMKPDTAVHFTIVPIKRGRYQIDFEIPGNVITKQPITIIIE